MCRFLLIIFCFTLITCQKRSSVETKSEICKGSKGALLGTSFNSFNALKEIISIDYYEDNDGYVKVTHNCGGLAVTSILSKGVSEKDFEKVQRGNYWRKIMLALKSPYVIVCRDDLLRVLSLSRRKGEIFGEGDKTFYDIAATMMAHISNESKSQYNEKHFSEKGFINTFNHITAQAFMTSLFSERLADYVADTHERARMPELVTGEFSDEQINDLDNGPVDNYVDIINNEWGQELGKKLKQKYRIKRSTNWTPELLANYLNDIQSYFIWAFQLSMEPFRDEDELCIKFSRKINLVLNNPKFL